MHRVSLLLAVCSVIACAQPPFRTWSLNGGPNNSHYSALDQINAANVRDLRITWKYDSGDAYPGSDIQCNPIVVDGVMYVTTPKLRVVALDAASGREIWSFDGAHSGRALHPNRGVTYWSDGKYSRIFITLGPALFSVDARTGKPDPSFGTAGKVDLLAAFEKPLRDTTLTVTTPGVIYRDLIILGSALPESLPALPGDIRAYNVRTGKLQWVFHTIPHPAETGASTWPPDAWQKSGAANNWAGMTVDPDRGTVFVPTGSPAFDFYGADRLGDDLFADSLLCLDAETGKLRWHFQAVRHDVWDLDFPSPPVLVRCLHEGKLVDAVAQAGKAGFLYVLDRATGKSLFPLEERPVKLSELPGEVLAKSELVPLKPAPFVRQKFDESTITTRTDEAHSAVLAQLKTLHYGSIFEPPSLAGTVNLPGLAGGAEWGGSAFDPETHLYYVNANELPWLVRLVPTEAQTGPTAHASEIYRSRCSPCHGPDRKGAPPEYPALNNLAGRISNEQIVRLLHQGSGRMPTFARLGDPAISALADFLLHNTDREVTLLSRRRPSGLKYSFEGYRKFLDPDGYPAITPPWGTLSAINLDTGEYAWQVPLGEYPELVAKGMAPTGSENHGGGVVTAGGLLFIGATHYDNKFRAFDKRTGKLVWEYTLPFAANATPALYEVNGKQYIAVAAGGGRERASGGGYVAFALP